MQLGWVVHNGGCCAWEGYCVMGVGVAHWRSVVHGRNGAHGCVCMGRMMHMEWVMHWGCCEMGEWHTGFFYSRNVGTFCKFVIFLHQ